MGNNVHIAAILLCASSKLLQRVEWIVYETIAGLVFPTCNKSTTPAAASTSIVPSTYLVTGVETWKVCYSLFNDPAP
jgi:hypothetical protein